MPNSGAAGGREGEPRLINNSPFSQKAQRGVEKGIKNYKCESTVRNVKTCETWSSRGPLPAEQERCGFGKGKEIAVRDVK